MIECFEQLIQIQQSIKKPKQLRFVTHHHHQHHIDTWKDVPLGPPDAILGLTVAFNNDKDAKKINLGVGAYRDDDGKPFVLKCVREAEKRIYEKKMDHEYAGISGVPDFVSASAKLLFGQDCPQLKNDEIVSAQSISGTGALRVAANFMRRFVKHTNDVYMPNPTWANHIPIFKDAGFNPTQYRYYDGKGGLNFEDMKTDIHNVPERSIILLHVCAHNPTGVDPTRHQWTELSKICKEKKHIVFFDAAYQGFATGDVEGDAWPIRKFMEDGHKPIVCQSFAKNFGLYGERAGAVHFVTNSSDEKARVDSQLKIVIRPMYSNPPVYGAKIVGIVLNDKDLSKLWYQEVKNMADRIITCRDHLVKELKNVGSKRNWEHIKKQIGMFCYSGLGTDQVERLQKEFHIYLTKDGRISMAGVNSKNINYLATSIKNVSG